MKFLVFQHVDVEHPGVFREFWREGGVNWTTVSFEQGDPIPVDLGAYDALVVMGGPMDVWETSEHQWLTAEIAAIRRFVVDLRKPYLGVCLGHQLLAHALGGEVATALAPEVGACAARLTAAAQLDALFEGLDSPLAVFQWHSCEVSRSPAGAVVLAQSDLCALQAFRWGSCAYGLQFHAEITEETPEEWASVPAYEQSLERALGSGAVARLSAETRELIDSYRRTASLLSRNFIAVVESQMAAVG